MNSKEGVAGVIKLLEAYDLTREDWDSIMEAGLFEGQRDPMTKIPSKVIPVRARDHFCHPENSSYGSVARVFL